MRCQGFWTGFEGIAVLYEYLDDMILTHTHNIYIYTYIYNVSFKAFRAEESMIILQRRHFSPSCAPKPQVRTSSHMYEKYASAPARTLLCWHRSLPIGLLPSVLP